MKKTLILLVLPWMLIAGLVPHALGGPNSTNDPFVARQWNLDRIQAFEAWTHATGKGAVVAVIDSGIDLTHPDLRANVLRKGKDFIDGGKGQDEFGHGTHVAGIIAAVTNNGEGIAGIAPDAKLMSVRVLDENNGSDGDEDIVAAIRWAADNGANVINASIAYNIPGYGQVRAGGPMGRKDYEDAIDYASKRGAVVVFASGNNYQPLCDMPLTPALCVGSTGIFDEKTQYSNFDATTMENYLVAPGGETISVQCTEMIISTWLRSNASSSPCDPPGYAIQNGTSMAAPAVAGVAALLVEQGLSNEEIVDRLLATADDLGTPGEDPVFGAGRVNALRAVTNDR